MDVVRKFLITELIWGAAITLLILPITVLSDPLSAAGYVRWLTRAFAVAAFPAGIAIAGDVFSRPRPWRSLVAAVAAAGGLAVLLFALVAFVAPLLGTDARTLPDLIHDMRAVTNSWETRNDAAWRFFDTLFVPVHVLLLAAIGLQVGVWAAHALPPVLRRALYWIVALGLMVADYTVADSTYEGILLHVPADVNFAAFYTLLVPLGICAGLGLPTLALLQGANIARSSS